MTLASSSAAPNRADDERSVASADQHACVGQGERSAENLWSTIRHHTSSWSLLLRLLALVTGLVVLAGLVVALMWSLGMRFDAGVFEIAPVG